MRQYAWLAACLLRPYTKPGHTITPDLLLGKETPTVEEAVELAYQKQAQRGDG